MIELTLDSLLSTEVEANHISMSAITNLAHALREMGSPMSRLFNHLNALFTWSDSSSPWRKWMHEDKSYSGTWTKRFAKYCYTHYDDKLTDDELTFIGNQLGKSVEKQVKQYFYEITHFMDWKAGNFNESNSSCWWNSKKSSRIGLSKHPDGYAVLFYENAEAFEKYSKKRGVGRCFAINTEKGFVIFNAYGIELGVIANALSQNMGLPFKKIIVIARNSWINRGVKNNEGGGGGDEGTGFIIGKNEVINGLEHLDIGNITLDEICQHCNKPMCSENGSMVDGIHWCADCTQRAYDHGGIRRCNKCEGFSEHTHKFGIRTLCDTCWDQLPECSIHGKFEGQAVSIWHTNKKACPKCIADGTVCVCDGCGRTVNKYAKIILPQKTVNLCVGCSRKAVHHAEPVTG